MAVTLVCLCIGVSAVLIGAMIDRENARETRRRRRAFSRRFSRRIFDVWR